MHTARQNVDHTEIPFIVAIIWNDTSIKTIDKSGCSKNGEAAVGHGGENNSPVIQNREIIWMK